MVSLSPIQLTAPDIPGALYLHPISKVLQLRTSLAYVDDLEANSRRMRGDVNGEDDAQAKAKSTPLARPSGLGPEREAEMEQNDGSGSLKDFRNKMLWIAQKEETDPWVPYKWLDDGAVSRPDPYRQETS